MIIVAEKREDLKENKESEAGKYFKTCIAEPIVEEVYSTAKHNHSDFAYDIALEDYDNHCNQAVEAVFDFDKAWISEILYNLSIDCEYRNSIAVGILKEESKPCSYWTEKLQKPCIDHMSSKEWEEVIQAAMVKTYEEKKGKIIQKAAKDAFDLEWKHSMEKDLYNPDPKKSTFSLVMERSINKPFATVFKDKFIQIYPDVY